MRITSTGMKARDLDLELGKLTLCTGGNSSGKSTLAAALKYLALGYIAGFGKSESATALFMRGTEMRVSAQLDDERTITRALAANGKGGFTGSVEASWVNDRNQGAHHQAILELFGKDELDVAQVLNIKALLDLSADKRAAAITKLLSAAARSVDDTLALLVRYTLQRLTETDDDHMPAANDPDGIRAVQKLVDQAIQKHVAAVWRTISEKLETVAVAGAIAWVNEQKKEADLETRRRTQAKVVIERRLQTLPDPKSVDLVKLQSRRDHLNREIGAHEAKVVATRKLLDQIATADLAVVGATDRLETARANRTRHLETPDRTADLEAARVAVDALQAPEAPAALQEAADREADAAAAEAEERAIVVPPILDLKDLEGRVQACEGAVQRLRQQPWRVVRSTLGELSGGKLNPKQLGLVQQLIIVADAELAAVATEEETAAQALVAAREAYEAALATNTTTQDAHDQAVAKQGSLLAKAARLRAEAKTLRARATSHTTALATYQQTRDALIEGRNTLATIVEAWNRMELSLTADVDEASRTLQAAQQRRDDLGTPPAEVVTPAALTGELATLQGQIEGLENAGAARRELSTIKAELERLEAASRAYAALEWGLQRIRREEIANTAAPLTTNMERFFRGAGLAWQSFIRAQGSQCAIGLRLPGEDDETPQERAVEVLGGAEWIVFTTALVAAMLALRPAALKLLIVEGAEADHGVLARLMKGIAAVSDSFTNAVVLSWHAPLHEIEGWDIIRLPQQAQAAAA